MTSSVRTRREFLRDAAVGVLLSAGGGSLLSACASGGGDGGGGGGGEAKTADNPFGVKASDPLDVVIFRGGYGDDYAKAHQDLYRGRFAGATVKHAGITDISIQLQPRFNGGTRRTSSTTRVPVRCRCPRWPRTGNWPI